MKKIFFLTVLFISSILPVFSQGYEIDIQFNVYNDTVILGHHRATQMIPDDTVVTDKNGYAVFKGNEKLPGGMYFVFFSNKRFFDMLIDKNQKFSIVGDTADFGKIQFKGDRQNQLFMSYQSEMRRLNNEMRSLQEQRATASDKAAVDKKMQTLRAELESLFDETTQQNADLFFADFLKATRDPQVPASITGDKERYLYFRNHYFDNFDYGDARLMRTPIYENKIETFLDKLLPQMPDTLIEAADMFVEASRGDDEHFQYILIHLFNKYASSQLMAAENVYVHLAEKYYIPEAKWSKREFIEDLKEKTKKKKRCLVGAKAHNINYFLLPSDVDAIKEMSDRTDTYKQLGLDAENSGNATQTHNMKVEILSRWTSENTVEEASNEIKAKYIIIWFWTPDCSHCREASPKFHDTYVEKKFKEKGVEVLAVYLNKNIDDWTDFTKEHKRWLDFIAEHNMVQWKNVWNPFDAFRSNFDIQSSPVLYMLDEDKKIIAKRIGWEQALEVIESELEN